MPAPTAACFLASLLACGPRAAAPPHKCVVCGCTVRRRLARRRAHMHACRFKLCPRREQVIKGLGVKNTAAVASTSQRDAVYCSDNCRNQHVQASAAAAAAARGHASPAAGRGHDDVAETPEGQQGPRDHASLHHDERPKGSSTAKGRGRKAGRDTTPPRPLAAVEPRAAPSPQAQGRPGRKAAVRAACSACGGKVCRIRMCRRSTAASLCMHVPRFFCRACAACCGLDQHDVLLARTLAATTGGTRGLANDDSQAAQRCNLRGA